MSATYYASLADHMAALSEAGHWVSVQVGDLEPVRFTRQMRVELDDRLIEGTVTEELCNEGMDKAVASAWLTKLSAAAGISPTTVQKWSTE